MREYLETLIQEKDLENELMDVTAEGTDYIAVVMSIQDVIEFILTLPVSVKRDIRNKLVMIDFKNGDVMHFFNYIANGMLQTSLS